MSINQCDCGQLFLPKGDRYSPDSGMRIRIISEDSYYDDTFLHNVDVLINSQQLFLTLMPRIHTDDPLYPKNIIVYLGSNTSNSPVLSNSIQIIIRVKETGQVLVNKVIGAIGDYSALQTNEIIDNNFAFTFSDTDILNTVDLNGKTLQLEIYSLCDESEVTCCDKLPSNMYLYNVININCTTTTSTTTSTSTTSTTTSTTTAPPEGCLCSFICYEGSWILQYCENGMCENGTLVPPSSPCEYNGQQVTGGCTNCS